MTVHPVTSRVFILPDRPAEKEGSLWLPDPRKHANRQDAATGIVVAMGKGMPLKGGGRWPMPDVMGKRVVYRQDIGQPRVLLDEVEHVVVRDEAILAVVEDEEPDAA